ncbi:MAG: hypothetical protein IT440_06475 [Phycisphaeraceae bacterium]|nr:hypothetical protein [Phycisphaeraceae bacterium]
MSPELVDHDKLDWIEPSLRALAMPIEQIKPDPVNARSHPQANLSAILASLRVFGQQKPIVVGEDGICLAGNGTLEAARKLGWTHLAAVRTRLAGLHARAYSIADNRTADTSQWNERQLAEHLATLQNAEDFDHQATGFSDDQIDDLIAKAVGLAQDEELGKEAKVEDLYQVLVACDDEDEQRAVYEQLTQQGRRCRLLTL